MEPARTFVHRNWTHQILSRHLPVNKFVPSKLLTRISDLCVDDGDDFYFKVRYLSELVDYLRVHAGPLVVMEKIQAQSHLTKICSNWANRYQLPKNIVKAHQKIIDRWTGNKSLIYALLDVHVKALEAIHGNRVKLVTLLEDASMAVSDDEDV